MHVFPLVWYAPRFIETGLQSASNKLCMLLLFAVKLRRLQLVQDNDTPVPMALASNTNPFASDELYQQSGEHELAQLARARLSGRLDPPLKQVPMEF